MLVGLQKIVPSLRQVIQAAFPHAILQLHAALDALLCPASQHVDFDAQHVDFDALWCPASHHVVSGPSGALHLTMLFLVPLVPCIAACCE